MVRKSCSHSSAKRICDSLVKMKIVRIASKGES